MKQKPLAKLDWRTIWQEFEAVLDTQAVNHPKKCAWYYQARMIQSAVNRHLRSAGVSQLKLDWKSIWKGFDQKVPVKGDVKKYPSWDRQKQIIQRLVNDCLG